MDRFLASTVNRIDAKGRVSVPAPFRSILQRQGHEQLYALRSLEDPAMDVGGPDLIEGWAKRLEQEDPFSRFGEDMSFYAYGDAVPLKLDGDGRITVTDFIREHTGITTDVVFVGRGHFFQMWEPSRHETQRQAVRDRLLSMRRQATRSNPAGDAGGGRE